MIIYKCKDKCLHKTDMPDRYICCAFCDYYAECDSEIKCDNKRVERCTDKQIVTIRSEEE